MEHLSDIAVFVRVADRGSFTAAAVELNLSKAVVSKYVSRLEQRLGARLLNRTTRRLTLTEAGAVLLEKSHAALSDLRDAELEVARLTDAPRGVLRVTAPTSFVLLHLGPLLPQFLARHPAVSLDLTLDDRLADLVGERYDVALRVWAALSDSSLVARRLAPCRLVVCAAPAYLKRRGSPKNPSELTRHNCLTYSLERTRSAWHFKAPGRRAVGVSVRGNLRCNNAIALKQATVEGAGILCCPTFFVGEELAGGKLVEVLPSYKVPELVIYAVYPQRRHLLPSVRAFVDFLVEKIPADPPWDRFRQTRRAARR